jgi:hypothetical protein
MSSRSTTKSGSALLDSDDDAPELTTEQVAPVQELIDSEHAAPTVGSDATLAGHRT